MTCRVPWDQLPENPTFCESRVWEHEWVNTFTSLMYTILGIYGFYASGGRGKITKTIFTNVSILGVGSALFHYENYALFARFDMNPIILVLSLLILFTLDSLIYGLSRDHYHTFSPVGYVACFLMYHVVMASTAVKLFTINTNEVIILMAFVELVFLLLFIISERNKSKEALPYMITSVILFAVASIVWFVIQEECNYWTKYTFAHGIWHVMTAHGLYYLTLSIHMIRHSMTFSERKNIFQTLYPVLAPYVKPGIQELRYIQNVY